MIDEGTTLVVAIGNLFVGALFVIRVTRGTGLWVSIMAGVVLGTFGWYFPKIGMYIGIFILLLIGMLELWGYRKKENYAYSHLFFEGGGIRRGLTPVDVAILSKLQPKVLAMVGITALLDKGLINLRVDNGDFFLEVAPELHIGGKIFNPHERKRLRKAAGRRLNQTISTSEDMLIELIEQDGNKGFGNIQYSVWIEFSRKENYQKMAGFDRDQTTEYYSKYINHRLTGVTKGYFPRKDFLTWMVLENFLQSQGENFIDPIFGNTQTGWLNSKDTLMDWVTLMESTFMYSDNL